MIALPAILGPLLACKVNQPEEISGASPLRAKRRLGCTVAATRVSPWAGATRRSSIVGSGIDEVAAEARAAAARGTRRTRCDICDMMVASKAAAVPSRNALEAHAVQVDDDVGLSTNL